MSYRKKTTKILVYCISILMILCFHLTVYALESVIPLSINSITVKNKGGHSTLESIKENGHILLKTNTEGLKKSYYTSEIYVKNHVDWSSYGEVSFYIKNLSKKPIKINFFVIIKDGSYLKVKQDRTVLLKKDKSGEMEIIHVKEGLFQLDNSFLGTAHIPLESLGLTKDNLKNVISFGIITTTAENIIQNIEIGDLKLISENNLAVPKEFSNLKVVGDRNVMKPIEGESIAQYNLIINNGQEDKGKNKASFYLKESLAGVSITEEGRLTVLSKATAKKISIKTVINNKFHVITEVTLSDSLVLGLKDKEGFSLAVPKVNEVEGVVNSNSIFNRPDMIMLFRGVIVLVISTILILYFVWRRKWQKENIS
ncbi:hypothetical protein RBU49_10255 [Clostridium sp. MB40-C1]|uniref:hypothetical protein n=1 Tax=Clostridium sp. MB40-C1 TaxID=3070996 RepID=UPI0027E1FD56|nr:hypothetical protein [Clostridium sp. MB40-C1]WMJ79271.1 hypothetical protein RBU49_10255 [Clostridium sp. MB40-C1]